MPWQDLRDSVQHMLDHQALQCCVLCSSRHDARRVDDREQQCCSIVSSGQLVVRTVQLIMNQFIRALARHCAAHMGGWGLSLPVTC